MLHLVLAAAFAAETPDAAVASALAATPPDLGSCFEGIEGHFSGEAAIVVSLGADGKPSKVAIDHADAAFPEDCALSVLKEVAFPAGERTIALTVQKSVDRTVVTYGARVGRLRLESASRPGVLACALLVPQETPDPATGAVVRYAFGPAGKVTSTELVFGGFTGDTLKACVLGSYKKSKLPVEAKGGAVIVWEPLRWTRDDV